MTLARLSELTGISQPKLSQFRKYQGVMLTYAEAESLAATLLPGFMLGLVPKPMAPIHLVENETEDASHD